MNRKLIRTTLAEVKGRETTPQPRESSERSERAAPPPRAAQHRDEVAGVLTDMMMPFMDGPATIRALQKMNPQVKIIAASGLAGQDKAAEATAAGVQQFLPKPYTAEKLLKSLAQLLRGGEK